MPRKCVNSFCYICGEMAFKSRRRSFTPLIKKCYEHYFGCKVGGQDNSWAPHFCCVTCQASRGTGKSFTLYAFRHFYGLERAHGPCFRLLLLPDQYHWCNSKSKHLVQYPHLPSAMRPVPRSAELPVSKPPTILTLSDSKSSDEDVGQANKNMDCDPTFAGASSSKEPHLLTQGDLNDIVRVLNLSRSKLNF